MPTAKAMRCLLGGAATWPTVAHAQGDPPTIGYLSSFSQEANRKFTPAFHGGLDEAGFREEGNTNIEYRWAEEGPHRAMFGFGGEAEDSSSH